MTSQNNENRFGLYTSKVDQEITGLSGAIYVHLETEDFGRACAIRYSHKQKDDSTLDRILTGLGDCATDLIRTANEARR